MYASGSGNSGVIRPSLDVTLLRIAGLWSQRSTCSRGKVGAVIAVDSRTISSGYNGAPPGEPHCRHDCDCDGNIGIDYGYPGAVSFTVVDHAVSCNSLIPCRISTHAEENAISFAYGYGVLGLGGATLYTTLSPCDRCAHMIINSGISRVVYGKYYRLSTGIQALVAAGVQCQLVELPPVSRGL